MSDFKNVLIVCRDLKSLQRLTRFNVLENDRYILASDDPKVHDAAKEYSWIDEFCWIEQMESFYIVAPDVIKYLEIINKWLITLANEKRGFSSELLFWIRQCEGGMTTQRIQDLLLLIRSYLYLFDSYDVKKVILLSHPCIQWEDSILIEAAQSRGLHVNVVGHSRINALSSNIQQYLEIYGRGLYYLFNFLRVKFDKSYRFKHGEVSDKEVVFQLCSSAKKHVNNIVPVMRALKHKGYKPVALCWSVTERYSKNNSSKQIRSEGLDAVELEKKAPFSCIFNAFYGVFSTWRAAKARYHEFLSLPLLQYKSVPLAGSLWPSMRFFLLAELMPTYIFNTAIKNYLDNHNPVGIKIWSEGVAPEGYLLLNKLTENNKPLVFYWKWVPFETPYDPDHRHIDLFLAAGDWHKKYYEKRGIPHIKIATSSMTQFYNIFEFKNKNSRDQSFMILGIPANFSKYILYDPNCILRGYLSVREQVSTLVYLLNFARKHPSVALLIKPHPAHHKGILDDMISQNTDLKNVFLLHKNIFIYDVLNVADVVITKFSTLGIEAMIFEKPVISILLDREEKWKAYGAAADYLYTLEEMSNLLEKIVQNGSSFKDWKNVHQEAQNEFLSIYINYDEHEKGIETTAAIIDEHLRKRSII